MAPFMIMEILQYSILLRKRAFDLGFCIWLLLLCLCFSADYGSITTNGITLLTIKKKAIDRKYGKYTVNCYCGAEGGPEINRV